MRSDRKTRHSLSGTGSVADAAPAPAPRGAYALQAARRIALVIAVIGLRLVVIRRVAVMRIAPAIAGTGKAEAESQPESQAAETESAMVPVAAVVVPIGLGRCGRRQGRACQAQRREASECEFAK